MKVVIAHTNKGYNSDGDNLINLQSVKRSKLSKKALAAIYNNPSQSILQVTDHEMFFCTFLKYKTDFLVFPEPNPVSFYYSLAKNSDAEVKEWKRVLSIYFIDKYLLPNYLQTEV